MIMSLPPEIESGNKEYKLKITDKTNDRIEQLASQLKWRLQEGKGTAEYFIGVADDGTIPGITYYDYIESIKNINKMAKIINAKIISKDKILINKFLSYYIIKITSEILDVKSLRIIFIGPSNSGKSTIIGNLSKKIKDNGNGKSRKYVFNHKHEIYSGETSSVSINNLMLEYKKLKLNINLIDTPGNCKYVKTMITAINKYIPDCIFLVLDPLETNIKSLTFYLNILKYYRYPFQIIFTKKDKYENLHKNYILKNILKICDKDFNDNNIQKIPYIEINNLTNNGYKKLLSCIKNTSEKTNLINKNNIDIQICDVLNIPNFSKIYTGLTFNKINIKDKKKLVTSDKIYDINFNTIFFLDKPKENIDKGHLITFTLNNEIDIDNKTDLIIIKNELVEYDKIIIKCDDKIIGNQGICIYNNQYKVIKICKKNEQEYELTSLDNTKFINLSKKIIIKINDNIYFTKLVY